MPGPTEASQFGPAWYTGGGELTPGATPGPHGYYHPSAYATPPGVLKRIADVSAGLLEQKLHRGPRPRYAGRRIAELSPHQRGAMASYSRAMASRNREGTSRRLEELSRGRALSLMEPRLERATEEIGERHRNPFIESVRLNVIRPLQEEMTENLLENILPQIDRAAISQGNYFGNTRSELRARALRDLNKVLAREEARALHEGLAFGQTSAERQKERELHGAQLVGNVGGRDLETDITAAKASSEAMTAEQLRDLAELEAEYGMGAKEQHLEQERLNKDYADFLEEEEGLMPDIERHAAVVRGMPVPQTRTHFTPREAEPSISRQLGGLGLMAAMTAGKDKMAAHGGRMRYASGGRTAPGVQLPSAGIYDFGKMQNVPSEAELGMMTDPRYLAIKQKYAAFDPTKSRNMVESFHNNPVIKGLDVGDQISQFMPENPVKTMYDFGSAFVRGAGVLNTLRRSQRQTDAINAAQANKAKEIAALQSQLRQEGINKDMARQNAYNALVKKTKALIAAANARSEELESASNTAFTMNRPKLASGGVAQSLDMWKQRLNGLRLDNSLASQTVQNDVVENAMGEEGDMGQEMAPLPEANPVPSPMPPSPISAGSSRALSALENMNAQRAKMEGLASSYEGGAHNRNPLHSLIEGVGAGLAGPGKFSEALGRGSELGLQGMKEARAHNARNLEVSNNIRLHLLNTYQKEYEDELRKETAVETAKIKAATPKAPKLYYNKKTGTHYMMGENGLEVAPGAPSPITPEETAKEEQKKLKFEAEVKEESENIKKLTESANKAQATIGNHKVIQRLLKKSGVSNYIGPIKGKFFNSPKVQALMGKKSVTAMQEFNAAINRVVLDDIKMMGANPSDRDVRIVENSKPSPTDTPQAALRKSLINEAAAKRMMEFANFTRRMWRDYSIPSDRAQEAYNKFMQDNPQFNETGDEILKPRHSPEDYLDAESRKKAGLEPSDVATRQSETEEAFEDVSEPMAEEPVRQDLSHLKHQAKRDLNKIREALILKRAG